MRYTGSVLIILFNQLITLKLSNHNEYMMYKKKYFVNIYLKNNLLFSPICICLTIIDFIKQTNNKPIIMKKNIDYIFI